jgi:hypothetical protein
MEKENKKIVKCLSWGIVIGIVLTLIVGFGFGGWVLGSTAQEKADQAAEKAVVNNLAPICVEQFQQDPAKEEKFKELEKISSWQRSKYVQDQGWATMPGREKSDRDIADKCAQKILDLDLK